MATSISIKWNGQQYNIDTAGLETVGTLKRAIETHTTVQPKRQKVLGLKVKGGKTITDDTALADLVLKPGQKLTVMGQPEAHVEALDKQSEVAPHVQDDFDIPEEDMKSLDPRDQDENQEKLKRRLSSVDVKILNPPREGKKCLVLDIDYTIFDLGSSAERPEELGRPYLHHFMTSAYEHYDLVIWSATSMKWVEVKMQQLGVTNNPNYKITFMLDHKAMITVRTEKYGVFDCKPLAFIWAKFPNNYAEDNTIMFDDLRRNYVMNPQNGLVIHPYKHAHRNKDSDKELLYLAEYLQSIASMPSLSGLRHSRWQRYLEKLGTGQP